MASADIPNAFSPATREWFRAAFGTPTQAQLDAWHVIAAHQHTLVIAPTGSGKTLAAFLWALDQLATSALPDDPRRRCRVLYISPLKALAVDVERNLQTPLAGIRATAAQLGLPEPEITVGMRTGDTPAAARRVFARTPPDILVTTPESLFLLLTSAARESLRGVSTVIVDEVHAVAGTKRGAHLALSLERLDALIGSPAQRIGLSATVRPVEAISDFLGGGQPVQLVQPAMGKTLDIRVEVPVADMSAPDAPANEDSRKASIWPSVERRILELVRGHRSTIVFTNSRRIAERLTARLNELAADSLPAMAWFPAEAVGSSGIAAGALPIVAKAHHGSLSRAQREVVEAELKAGQLPCVVATSSLELGIDMGAVDLVIQVEAPPTVAAGLQRIGRAGHHIGSVSTGVLFPKFRGDLPICAVTAERMSAGAIESTRYPRNPLDVLAQHVVSMVAMEPWSVAELARVVRRAAPFHGLPESALHAVLDMLAGRYPSEDFGALRARITWDRETNELRGRPGSQRLAVISGGTIPDRGLFTVTTENADGSGSRVGELDEEMVYESRVGDTILLGTTSWRIQDITHDRVVVVPAPGEAARLPFWKGDTQGRPLELSKAVGDFIRSLSTMDSDAVADRLTSAGLDAAAQGNLMNYIAEQQAATGRVPDDRTIVVERFRDELGDWRLVVHSSFGGKVNAPWALAITARLRERMGLDAQVVAADDGIVIRLPDAVDDNGIDALPGAEDLLFDPEDIERIVRDEVGSSALFASIFRECAARSLLLPRRDPRKRSPLWQQRQRSAQLLSVAARYEQFPVVLEAMRECLQDIYDLPGLQELMGNIRSRQVRVFEVPTASASPFARSLLFGYVGMFLYQGDTPLAERRAAALSLDSTLLAELLGASLLRELIDPDVLIKVERSLQRLNPEHHARDGEDAIDLLRSLGDLSIDEAAARGVRPEWLTELTASRRAFSVSIAGTLRYVAVEDAGRIRDALGVVLPAGIPQAFTEPAVDPLGNLIVRYARGHGPFSAEEVSLRFGVSIDTIRVTLHRLTSTGQLISGELRPPRTRHAAVEPANGIDYCDPEVLRRLRKASLSASRAAVEPVAPVVLGRFLPYWHGITADADQTARLSTVDELLSVVEQLAGVPLPASSLESLILPARLPRYSPALLDELTATGEVAWSGCGVLGEEDGWVALAPADLAQLLLPDALGAASLSPLALTLVSVLEQGALFFPQLLAGLIAYLPGDQGRPADDAVVAALWELVWAGRVTNDTLAPLRMLLSGQKTAHKPRRSAPRGRYAQLRRSIGTPRTLARPTSPAIVSGRWSLLPTRESDPTRRAHAMATAFLERHGVVTKGALNTERVSGGFSALYRVLRAMEESGSVVRGYVVDGLGAAQFAVKGAVDQLRTLSTQPSNSTALVLAAADPAQPYGAALPWPSRDGLGSHRPARKSGALVILVDGQCVLYLERGGKTVLTFTNDEKLLGLATTALAESVRQGRLGQLVIHRGNGENIGTSRLANSLRNAGFRLTPQGFRLRTPPVQ